MSLHTQAQGSPLVSSTWGRIEIIIFREHKTLHYRCYHCGGETIERRRRRTITAMRGARQRQLWADVDLLMGFLCSHHDRRIVGCCTALPLQRQPQKKWVTIVHPLDFPLPYSKESLSAFIIQITVWGLINPRKSFLIAECRWCGEISGKFTIIWNLTLRNIPSYFISRQRAWSRLTSDRTEGYTETEPWNDLSTEIRVKFGARAQKSPLKGKHWGIYSLLFYFINIE